jgi:hypothetical protein
MTEPSKGSNAVADPKAGQTPPSKDLAPAESKASNDDAKTSAADEAPRFPVDQLIKESRSLLGCSRHVAVGALHGEDRKTLTQEQGREAVAEFRTRKAKAPVEGEDES